MATAYARLKLITEHSNDNQKCAKKFGLTPETVARYRRRLGRVDKICETPAPNVWLFDIETIPMEVFVWGLYKQRINPDNVIKDWSICCWSAKKLFRSEVVSRVITPSEAKDRGDKSIIEDLWNLFENADVLIAHNASSFDIRKSNYRFLINGFHPPSPHRVIDTLTASRKAFASSSHKLDYLAQVLLRKQKIETDFKLWKRCVAGEKKALDEMVEYNREDVRLLEEVYLELRPWMTGHPNMGLYVDLEDADSKACPVCTKETLTPLSSSYYTPAGKFNAYRCKCGAIARGRHNTIKDKTNLALSVAR